MERKKSKSVKIQSKMLPAYTLSEQIRIWVLFILHIVGAVGFLMPDWKVLFVSITYLHLFFITVILFFEVHLLRVAFGVYLVASITIGFFSEVFGVKSGLLFGYYHYTDALGPKLLDVPLIIGILWAGLGYACNQIAVKIFNRWWVSAIASALLMALFDYLIEPFAIANGLWVWHQSEVPLYNYISWFMVGLIISVVYKKLLPHTAENKVAPYYLLSQALFFIVLQIADKDWGFF